MLGEVQLITKIIIIIIIIIVIIKYRLFYLKIGGLAHNPHGKLGLIVEHANINEMRYPCSVHMYQCIN